MTNKRIKEIMNEVAQKNERFAKLSPETPMGIEEWREVIKANFPELVLPAEIGLSVIAQLLIKDITNPFALVYVDAPSSGKTITLNFFSTIEELVYTTDNFTPASFVSHAANKKAKELEKTDMLPQIQYKTLLIRDLVPAFAKKDENVQEMLGIFIRVLDGEGLETNSGLYGKRGYKGDYLFMMLSASTPIKSRIWRVMGSLGSRLFFVNIGGEEKTEKELAEQLKESCSEKEKIVRKATGSYLKTLWSKNPFGINWAIENDDVKFTIIIAKFAKALARLRSAIGYEKDDSSFSKKNLTSPITEMPDRLNQLLYNLARGHALTCGRKQLNDADLKIVARVALDSAPPKRSQVFKHLILCDGSLYTKQVMELLKVSRPTALKIMRELVALDLVRAVGNLESQDDQTVMNHTDQIIKLTEKFSWFKSEECKNLIKHTVKNGLLTKFPPV